MSLYASNVSQVPNKDIRSLACKQSVLCDIISNYASSPLNLFSVGFFLCMFPEQNKLELKSSFISQTNSSR